MPAAFLGANCHTKFGRLRFELQTGLSAELLGPTGGPSTATIALVHDLERQLRNIHQALVALERSIKRSTDATRERTRADVVAMAIG